MASLFSRKPRFDGHHRSWKAAPSYAQASAGVFWWWAEALTIRFDVWTGPFPGRCYPSRYPVENPYGPFSSKRLISLVAGVRYIAKPTISGALFSYRAQHNRPSSA
jgi:hypothetical protein